MIQINALTDNEILKNILTLVRDRLPYAQVILFGSRAEGTNRENSDFDIAIKSANINIQNLTLIRDKINKLQTLKNIEIINYYDLDENVKRIVDNEGILLK